MNETYEVEQWEAGTEPTRTTQDTLVSGQNVAKYAPLGRVTATGKLKIWNPAGSDGSEVAVRIAAEAVDATSGDVKAQFIKAGCFNIDAVAWPGTPTDVQKMNAFNGTPISLQPLVS